MPPHELPLDPLRMNPVRIALGIALLPAAVFLLIFWPAGGLDWIPGWRFVAAMTALFTISTLILARLNPVIFRARSRFQLGTEHWDLVLLAMLLPAMAAVLPVASLDAGRFAWSNANDWVVWIGFALLTAAITLQTWAQAVNPFFEQGVRIQSERHHRVIDSGPYRMVRHPGYASALLMLPGVSLALGSFWGLVPACLAAALLVIRTQLEDRLLNERLAGYADYVRRTRWRLIPGLW